MKSSHPYMPMCRALALVLLVLLAGAGGAQAQGEGAPRAADDAWARYAPELARLQTQITLLRREMIALASRPSREADSALKVLEPRWREVAVRLEQLEVEMGRDAERRAIDARSFRRLSTMNDSLRRRVQVRLGEASADAPAGYMGVGLVGRSRDADPWTKLYLEYPVVQTVDPGSPADRAGLLRGDTLVAYDGVDVRSRPVELRRLLRPGSTVVVTVRRAGRTQELPMTIARRQQARAWTWTDDGATTMAFAPLPPGGPGAVGGRVRVPARPAAPGRHGAPVASYVHVYGGGGPGQTELVAGAEVVRVTPDLGEPFGVETGLLVLGVAANTPAAQAGLRGGDVIVRVNGREVALPVALRRAVDRSAEHAVDLEIVRKKKRRAIRLEW